MSEPEVDEYRGVLPSRQPNFGARPTEIVQRSLGTPYADDPPGEGPEGKYDKDPPWTLLASIV